MKILVTGASGFSGRHLIAWLEQQRVGTLYRTDLQGQPTANFSPGNLGDFAFVEQLLATVRPERIYHLAGTFTNDYPTDYLSNVESSRNIFEAVRQLALPLSRFADGYGLPNMV